MSPSISGVVNLRALKLSRPAPVPEAGRVGVALLGGPCTLHGGAALGLWAGTWWLGSRPAMMAH